MKQSSAFSLIELLVVIGILGLLSTMLLPNFTASRERARDTQRKSDLKQIQNGLELYKQNQALPAYVATIPTADACWSSGASCTGTIYMKRFPQDPLGSSTSVKKYYYSPDNVNIKYTLSACAENKADSEAIACPADFGSVAGYACASNKCYSVSEP